MFLCRIGYLGRKKKTKCFWVFVFFLLHWHAVTFLGWHVCSIKNRCCCSLLFLCLLVILLAKISSSALWAVYLSLTNHFPLFPHLFPAFFCFQILFQEGAAHSNPQWRYHLQSQKLEVTESYKQGDCFSTRRNQPPCDRNVLELDPEPCSVHKHFWLTLCFAQWRRMKNPSVYITLLRAAVILRCERTQHSLVLTLCLLCEVVKFNVRILHVQVVPFSVHLPFQLSEHLRPSVNTQVDIMRIYNGFVLINCYNDFWC